VKIRKGQVMSACQSVYTITEFEQTCISICSEMTLFLFWPAVCLAVLCSTRWVRRFEVEEREAMPHFDMLHHVQKGGDVRLQRKKIRKYMLHQSAQDWR